MASRWDAEYRGNPVTQLGNFATPRMPQRKIRCVVPDFFVSPRVGVAEAGKTYNIDSDLARALVQFGRAEYAE